MRTAVFLGAVFLAVAAAVFAQPGGEGPPPELMITLGTPITATVVDDPYWMYYWYEMPESSTFAIQARLSFSSGAGELYARYSSVPSMVGEGTAPQADFYDTVSTGGVYQITIPSCAGDGVWWIGVYISTANNATFTLLVTQSSVNPQPLTVNGASVSGTLQNQNYQLYYFDVPDNNSFVGVSLVNTNNVAGSTALYLRPMLCPTMFQYSRVGAQTGVQSAFVSCTETMGGRWFVSAMSISGAQATYQLRALSSPFIEMEAGVPSVDTVPSPAGLKNYRTSVPQAAALRVQLTATTPYRTMHVYLNRETCSTDSQMTRSVTLSSAAGAGSSTSALFPVNAGDWYLAVSGDCLPSANCGFSLTTTQERIACSVPTAQQASFCSPAGLEWTVGNYTDLTAGDLAAQVMYSGLVARLDEAPTPECDYVLRMYACASNLPKCGVVGLPTSPCRPLCWAVNRCLRSALPCEDLRFFARGTECSAPARYSAAPRLASPMSAVMTLVLVSVAALLLVL